MHYKQIQSDRFHIFKNLLDAIKCCIERILPVKIPVTLNNQPLDSLVQIESSESRVKQIRVSDNQKKRYDLAVSIKELSNIA